MGHPRKEVQEAVLRDKSELEKDAVVIYMKMLIEAMGENKIAQMDFTK